MVWAWLPTLGLPSLIKAHTEEEKKKYNPFYCKMCVHCFNVNARQPVGCAMCKHPCELGLTFRDACDTPALKLIKCVHEMENLCDGTVKEIEINPTRLNRWCTSHIARESRIQMIIHEVKAMREFHVKLACVSCKTDHCPLLDMIMTRFNHQPKTRDSPQPDCTLPMPCGVCAP